MDLHIIGGDPSDEERAAVDALLGPPDSGWTGGARDIVRDGRTSAGGHAVTGDRHRLLPAFHAVQDRIGWISRGALNYICRRLTVPPAEAWGVLTFYHLLATTPRPPAVAHVCDDIACRLGGAERLCEALEAALGPPLAGGHPAAAAEPDASAAATGGDTPLPAALAWQRSPCLGQCDAGSAALILRAGDPPSRTVLAPVPDAAAIVAALEGAAVRDEPRVRSVVGMPRLLARAGRINPHRLESYQANGGYRALTRAVEIGPERVVAVVSAARLLGRGGAAFPTGRKWDAVRRQPATPHFVVCNADESEPGTFKDRVLMEGDPFAVIEAMTVCGWATGAARGFLYVRGEYPLAEARLAAAITQAHDAGLLGADILGSGWSFDIEIRRGGGAYICGEETALFNSIEGRRGEPRAKPPFPAERGVFGKPTVANNVETLVNVLDILTEGVAAWAEVGTADSTGPRLFCVSGQVRRPGLYEVPSGIVLRDLLTRAGGVRHGRTLRAVLLGGAAGGFVGPAELDLALSFEGARAAGATLGSGVVMVFDDTADLADTLRRIAAFFRDESCGQCVPCRVGTVRQQELLERILRPAAGPASSPPPAAVYAELAAAMKDASICGLGQTAASAIESAFARGLLGPEMRP